MGNRNTAVGGNALLNRMGLSGYNGITVAADLTVATQLDITVAAGAWLLTAGGEFFDTTNGLATTTITGLSVNGVSYHLYAGNSAANDGVPGFYVATAHASADDVALAAITVAGNVITVVTPVASGLTSPVLTAGSWSGPVIESVTAVAVLELDTTLGPVYTKSIAAPATFTASDAGTAGQRLTLIIDTDTTQRVATFGTHLNAVGTLTIPASKVGTISFVSDGTSFRETARAICA